MRRLVYAMVAGISLLATGCARKENRSAAEARPGAGGAGAEEAWIPSPNAWQQVDGARVWLVVGGDPASQDGRLYWAGWLFFAPDKDCVLCVRSLQQQHAREGVDETGRTLKPDIVYRERDALLGDFVPLRGGSILGVPLTFGRDMRLRPGGRCAFRLNCKWFYDAYSQGTPPKYVPYGGPFPLWTKQVTSNWVELEVPR
jgi:hypothetical protein